MFDTPILETSEAISSIQDIVPVPRWAKTMQVLPL